MGGAMSPFNAFQFIQGLETLPLRIREHCKNANEIANFLNSHEKVTNVIYPGLMKVIIKRELMRIFQEDMAVLLVLN